MEWAGMAAREPDDQGLLKCSGCHKRLPLAEFTRSSQTPSGYAYRCRACIRRYRESWFSKLSDQQRADMEQQKHARYERRRDNTVWLERIAGKVDVVSGELKDLRAWLMKHLLRGER